MQLTAAAEVAQLGFTVAMRGWSLLVKGTSPSTRRAAMVATLTRCTSNQFGTGVRLEASQITEPSTADEAGLTTVGLWGSTITIDN